MSSVQTTASNPDANARGLKPFMNRRTNLPDLWRRIAVICCLAIEVAAGQFGDFSYTDDGVSITITGYPSDAVGAAVVPEFIDGKPVTGIGEWAFYNCTGLTSIVIPGSVESIGLRAFSDCIGLTDVSIPAGVLSIGEMAFVRCTGMTNLVISNTVTTIGESAFAACISLTSVTIPDSVTNIGDGAFGACHALMAITAGASNPFYVSVDGVLFSRNMETLVQYPAGKTGHAVIPNGVITIGNGAFYDCKALTNLTMPSGLTHIGREAFLNCEQLSSVVLPSSVRSIGDLAFMFCFGLENLEFQDGLSSIGEWAFFQCQSLIKVQVPDSVEAIGKYAFSNCASLISVRLSGSMNRIENDMFMMCTLLESVNIPTGITEIGENAFGNCSSLSRITIPESVTSIESNAFYGCNKLESVIIPGSVIMIGDAAFYGCDRLESACFKGDAPVMGTDVFGYVADGVKVYFFHGASDFSSPEWLGYPALVMGDPSAVAPWLVSYGFTYDSDLQEDPNADGVNLLMAYALDLDPRKNLGGSMPVPVVSGNKMSLKFHATSQGVSYTVECSSDLQNWSSTGISLSDPDMDGFRNALVDMNGSACFMRILVAY